MLRISQTSRRSPKLDRTDRLVRYVVLPVVFALGLYGLVRYVATGDGATAENFPALEQRVSAEG